MICAFKSATAISICPLMSWRYRSPVIPSSIGAPICWEILYLLKSVRETVSFVPSKNSTVTVFWETLVVAAEKLTSSSPWSFVVVASNLARARRTLILFPSSTVGIGPITIFPLYFISVTSAGKTVFRGMERL